MIKKILLIDDDEGIQFSFSAFLKKKGYSVELADSIKQAKMNLNSFSYDIVIIDYKLPDGDGIDFLEYIKEEQSDASILVITGNGNISLAVKAMSMGADNFLTKPVNMQELNTYLQKSDELITLRKNLRLADRIKNNKEPFWGSSRYIKNLKKLVDSAAEIDSNILLQGESGTGKEITAKWIHQQSERANAPFVEVNCAVLNGDLLASELFGHAKGAFTNAMNEKEGLIEVASEGTLFLDEISSMDKEVQAMLLKVIEEKKFRRLGETKVRESNFRLICASNKDLNKEIQNGNFRSDLFYRINVYPIELPPLREFKKDIEMLIEHLLSKMNYKTKDIDDDAIQLLKEYDWPGNIRELKNVLERALIISEKETLMKEDFPGIYKNINNGNFELKSLKEIEKEYCIKVLQRYENDVNEAAKALGLSRATFYRKIK